MDYSALVKSVDDLASDLLFLDGGAIDVPSSGKFMNRIEDIIKAAESLRITPLIRVATAMNHILEKIVFDALKDKDMGFSTFEKGIVLMQEIAENCQRIGEYTGDIQPFLETVATVTGVAVSADACPSGVDQDVAPEAVQEAEIQVSEAKTQIQDVSLVKDFVAEGIEYIDEIEVNILNLEQNPENADYINAIFRPFHSIKGVAGFLNLEKIQNLAHNLGDR